jgi:hypothetical protein
MTDEADGYQPATQGSRKCTATHEFQLRWKALGQARRGKAEAIA